MANFSNPWSPTPIGLDGLPAWFLHLGTPVFFRTIAYLFNLLLATSTIPQQCKQASIIGHTQVSSAQTACRLPADLHHIRPHQNRGENRSSWIPLTLLSPPLTLSFSDQFAFRPTGTQWVAIFCLLNTITNIFLSNPSVTVISLHFSKTFDTVRHSTFLHGEDGPAGSASQCLQLVCWFLQWAHSLHCVPWRNFNSEVHHSN